MRGWLVVRVCWDWVSCCNGRERKGEGKEEVLGGNRTLDLC